MKQVLILSKNSEDRFVRSMLKSSQKKKKKNCDPLWGGPAFSALEHKCNERFGKENGAKYHLSKWDGSLNQ